MHSVIRLHTYYLHFHLAHRACTSCTDGPDLHVPSGALPSVPRASALLTPSRHCHCTVQDRWDMAGSTYAYCYAGCHMPWFINNRVRYNLSAYAGVVGVDHCV